MKFSKLRLSGFKSFADPTELIIQPGLTGVVGPNGCGKSNLLEALRWVMGESSYKNMRATGMEDVIFAGSTGRPGRNMAEVSVFLDNEKRSAPPAFNDADQLEITRRIQHEAGSAYRINGKEVRAKDVHLLFADASTGAHSPALVRQGQIGEIINAKPTARRRILEEAAGITGLHTRRHEALLRLNGAETNLTRLDDVIGQMETQLSALKRQARQAKRYKKVSAEIRNFEAILLYLRWRDAATAASQAEHDLQTHQRGFAEKTQNVAEAGRLEAEAAAQLPVMRENEAKAAAGLQRTSAELQKLEAEERHAKQRAGEIDTQLDQAAHDIGREREMAQDAAEHLERLGRERQDLEGLEAERTTHAGKTQADLGQTEAALRDSEKVLDDASQSIAQLNAREAALAQTIDALGTRRARIDEQLDLVATELAGMPDTGAHSHGGPDGSLDDAQRALDQADEAAMAAEQDLESARAHEAEQRTSLEEKQSLARDIETEIRTLTKLLKLGENGLWPPVVDALDVKRGYEMALGAALGEDLDAPLDDKAPVYWTHLDVEYELADLPEDVMPLSDYVKAPDALSRRLNQVGVVAQSQGTELQATLKPGQRLVSREGDVWRWDGFTMRADAETAAAKRLAERNRLGELEASATNARRDLEAAVQQFDLATGRVSESTSTLASARDAWRKAQENLNTLRTRQVEVERELGERAQRAAALKEAAVRLAAEREECDDNLRKAEAELAGSQGAHPADGDLEKLRQTVVQRRTSFAEARAAHEAQTREAQTRTARLQALGIEQNSWRSRADRAKQQIATLEARIEKLQNDRLGLDELPKAMEAQRAGLLDAKQAAEKSRAAAADRLAEAETALGELTRALRAGESELADTREAVARIETRLEAARERQGELAGEIRDVLSAEPEAVPQATGFENPDALPDIENAEIRLEKLQRERERLGAVNLRAEEEAEDLNEQLDSLVRERDDLINAIQRLRQGIGTLNKEGRTRLLKAFDTVNDNFQKLFKHLFGGGDAKLELIEADDPLEAGLEIFARPPGKRLQALSLLSGGEQALTALSLIFAVFLTNPSPICVLDEVDAPLDDANVERFCNLMDEMTRTTDTRYLIITHHALTMSRVNRLFGVTMSERGVSQMVSVDLEAAEKFRDTG